MGGVCLQVPESVGGGTQAPMAEAPEPAGLATGRRGWSGAVLLLDEPDDLAGRPDLAVAAADDVGDQAGPAGLVPGAERRPVVTVEVLAEDQVVPPGRVVLEPLVPAEAGPPAAGTAGEQGNEPVLEVGSHLVQGELGSAPGRVLDREVVAEEPAVPFQGADDQVVQREPERAAPVGVAAEHRRGGLGGFVVDAGRDPVDLELVRVLAVVGRQRPQAVRGQELALVEQPGHEPLEPVLPGQAEQELLLAGLAAQDALLAQGAEVGQAVAAQQAGEPLAYHQCQPQVLPGQPEDPLLQDRVLPVP